MFKKREEKGNLEQSVEHNILEKNNNIKVVGDSIQV